MLGKMMTLPLTIGAAIDHADRYHGTTEVVGVETDGRVNTSTWADVARRSRQLGSALSCAGLARGDRVATIAWNNLSHLEIYFGVSSAGFVCHTINPRLFADQLEYIVAQAADRILFVDQTFLPIVAKLRDRLSVVERVIVLSPRNDDALALLADVEFYDEFLTSGDDAFIWPDIDETETSSLCFTSGTTGNPKGVAYSHRSTLLHSMALLAADGMGLSARESVLAVVPMFHVNAWGIPYGAAMAGARLVLPGPKLDGDSLLDLIQTQKVTFAAGVPTIWAGLLDALGRKTPKHLSLTRTIVGGAACPPSMMEAFRDSCGVEVIHGWGMTETSPLGLINHLKNAQLDLPETERNKIRTAQGRPPFGVELRLVGEDGVPLTNAADTGELQIRGHWVVDHYFNMDSSALQDGWFDTGDVATIDQDGFVMIRDRSKDLIKSGGEWISSVDLENIAVALPQVADAAAIGVPDAKWGERPVLIVKLAEDAPEDAEAILAHYDGKVAKWQIPDRVHFVEDIPRNATGKIVKTQLREKYASS